MIDMEEYLDNPIKKHIIGKLFKTRKLKYSELMPDNVDNVLFNYHLQHLVKTGLLTKEDNVYTFSLKGVQLTSNISYDGLYFPKFVCRYRMFLIDNDKVLLQHRKSPWYKEVTGLSSKLVYGTRTEERANIRMKMKAGVETKMSWLGTLRMMVFNPQKDLVDDSMYFICYATSFKGTINETDDNGDPLKWHSFEEAIELEKKNKRSGLKSVEILERLKNKNYEPFAFEEQIKIEAV